jgi:hypothetical protein
MKAINLKRFHRAQAFKSVVAIFLINHNLLFITLNMFKGIPTDRFGYLENFLIDSKVDILKSEVGVTS